MTLRPADEATLVALGLPFRVEVESNHTCVVISDYPLPDGLRPRSAALLIRLPPGFPDTAADMFWLSNGVVIDATSAQPPATNVIETYLGQQWHRWSRHPASEWRSGIDDLRSFLAYVHRCISHEARRAA